MARTLIEARNISKSYDGADHSRIQVIAPLSLSIEAGEIVSLLGPFGIGQINAFTYSNGAIAAYGRHRPLERYSRAGVQHIHRFPKLCALSVVNR